MPSSPSRSDPSRQEAPGDFLHDPSLWEDLLPQPFRMIDDLLEDVILQSLEIAEQREEQERRDKEKKRVPLVEEACAIGSVPEPMVIDRVDAAELEKLVVVAGSQGLHVLCSASGEVASRLACGPVAAVSTVPMPLLSVQPAVVLAIVLKTGILKLCVLMGASVTVVTELPSEVC